jgi:selenide, water dikinase
VKASGAGLQIEASRLPVLPGTRELAEAGQFSGGMKRNRRYVDEAFGAALTIESAIPGYLASLLSEAETSGGLLFSVAADRAGAVTEAFRRQGEECWEIGLVLPEPVIRIKA